MVRLIVLTVVLHALIPALARGSEPQPAMVWHRDLIKASRVASTQKRLLLLFLTTPDCVFCRRMIKKTLLEPQINMHVNRRYVAVQLNGNANPELLDQLQARVFPTTVIVHPAGKVIAIMRGYKAPGEFALQLVKIQSNLDRQHAPVIVARRNQ